MIIPLITSIIIANSLEDKMRDDSLNFKLHRLSKEIYSTIPQHELDFLYSELPAYNLPIFETYWLIEKYGNKINKIYNIITDSEMSTIKNKIKTQPVNNITIKQALIFTYVASVIANKEITLEEALSFTNSLFVLYHSINIAPRISINNDFQNKNLETKIINALDSISFDIIKSLSKNEKKCLSEAPDVFIMKWFFRNKWLMPKKDYEFVDRIINEIDDEMIKYLHNRYNLKLTWVDEFRVHLVGAFLSGKLKNNNHSIETCVQMFETFDHLIKPKKPAKLPMDKKIITKLR